MKSNAPIWEPSHKKLGRMDLIQSILGAKGCVRGRGVRERTKGRGWNRGEGDHLSCQKHKDVSWGIGAGLLGATWSQAVKQQWEPFIFPVNLWYPQKVWGKQVIICKMKTQFESPPILSSFSLLPPWTQSQEPKTLLLCFLRVIRCVCVGAHLRV